VDSADLTAILHQIEDERAGKPGQCHSQDWMDEVEGALVGLGATKLHLTFSGGNDEGGMDDCTITDASGRQRQVDYITADGGAFVNVGGQSRYVRHQRLVHPQAVLINQAIDAAWTPIGREYGGFATSEDAHVSGSVTVDLTQEEEDLRFEVDLGDYVVTYSCGRGDCENTVEGAWETCEECASKHWCADCGDVEVDAPGQYCEACQPEEAE
jgi:hypothetical protein